MAAGITAHAHQYTCPVFSADAAHTTNMPAVQSTLVGNNCCQQEFINICSTEEPHSICSPTPTQQTPDIPGKTVQSGMKLHAPYIYQLGAMYFPVEKPSRKISIFLYTHDLHGGVFIRTSLPSSKLNPEMIAILRSNSIITLFTVYGVHKNYVGLTVFPSSFQFRFH